MGELFEKKFEKKLIPKKEEPGKGEEKEKKEEELTPEERKQIYVLTFTPEGEILHFLKEHANFSPEQTRKEIAGRIPHFQLIWERLKKLGVLEIENERVTKINLENLEKVWEEQKLANAILKLVGEKGPIPMGLISKFLKEEFDMRTIFATVSGLGDVGLLIGLKAGGLNVLDIPRWLRKKEEDEVKKEKL